MKVERDVRLDLETICHRLIERYYSDNLTVRSALDLVTPAQFIRLFIIASGMKPIGLWSTHTYCKIFDAVTQKHHFFLVPMPTVRSDTRAFIRIEKGILKIDEFDTNVKLQSIPYTTPFWYFHYNPNLENIPYYSLTLNLSPSCLEKCVLCAGAKTGRVNTGMVDTLDPEIVSARLFNQHPDAKNQLNNVAIVTGCFENFTKLESHLRDVKNSISRYASPSSMRVLEHNITTHSQFETIVGGLGYEIFITMECFDQKLRHIALNGKVGQKGRDSETFIDSIEAYATYLEKQPKLNHTFARITYLSGLDSLDIAAQFFERIASINKKLTRTKIVPWMSIFTIYNKAMEFIQRKDFGLAFLLQTVHLANQYFGEEIMVNESGGTGDGYARGLY